MREIRYSCPILQALIRGRYPSELACPWQREAPDRKRLREITRGAYDPGYLAREGALRCAKIRANLAAFVLGGLEPKIADVQWLKPKGSPGTVTLWDASQTTGHTLIVTKDQGWPRWEALPSRTRGSGTCHRAGGASRGDRIRRRACPRRLAARLSAPGSAASRYPVCSHTRRSGHLRHRRVAAHPPGKPGRQGDQIWMTRWRLSCSIPFLALIRGTLKAEREREHQHDQAEETHHPQYEQSNYRCDRVFYVTVWLAHLLSSVLNRRLMPS